MSHRATCRDCEWSGDADTLSGAAREADEHRQETGHDAKVERDLATDGGVDGSADGVDRCDYGGCDEPAAGGYHVHGGDHQFCEYHLDEVGP